MALNKLKIYYNDELWYCHHLCSVVLVFTLHFTNYKVVFVQISLIILILQHFGKMFP